MIRGLLRVNLAAVTKNYQTLCDAARGRVGAVVKANAYGLGASAVVRHLIGLGCKDFFVETLDEALALSDLANVDCYVFSGPDDVEAAREMGSLGVIPVANFPEQLSILRQSGIKHFAVHVDTGMQRMGFAPADFRNADLSDASIKLLMTHLACADRPNHPLNARQVTLFSELRKCLPGVMTSIGNSAATLMGPDFQGGVARPGIGLYGGNPFSDRPNPMRCVCTLEARVLQVRSINAEESVGYGATVVATRPTTVAVIGIGYADGISRRYSIKGSISFKGQKLPLLGMVSMDMMQVDATTAPDIRVGDWVEVFGPNLPLDEVAEGMETISYEVLAGLSPRLEREYVYD